jgi:hypothetical protein
MQALINEDSETGQGQHATNVALCRSVLKRRTRYYLAQREAGISAQGAGILDLVVLGQIEGCCMDVAMLSDVLNLSNSAVRLQVVDLIKGGWVVVRNSDGQARLHMTDKAADCASTWIELTLNG